MSNSIAWGEKLAGLPFLKGLAEDFTGSRRKYWTKTSLDIMKMIRKDQFDLLVDFELDPDSFNLPEEYLLCAQLLALFKKVADLPIKRDTRLAAWEKFTESEESCKATNDVFKAHAEGKFQFLPHVEVLLFQAQRKIARVLGSRPSLEDFKFRLGSGAVRRVPKRIAVAATKLRTPPNCSSNCVSLARAVLAELPMYTALHATCEGEDSWDVPLIIERGRVSFVPKNAKIDRVTITEPSLNVTIQLGIGSHIFNRLKRVGVDLSDQTKNQRLARIGSLTGALATLDLSSASDTIARELVAHLLPWEWYTLLDDSRTNIITHPYKKNQSIYLEKFSSMGNGFTFPLESLIFWALISAVCGEDSVSVYGDDLIVPTDRYDEVVELLLVAGFKVNQAKSFKQGPFRESCGKDYFNGIDVRPLFLKTLALDTLEMYRIHNFWVRQYESELAASVLERIPTILQLWGPDGFGDGHLISPDFKGIPHGRKKGWAGRIFRSLMVKTASLRVPPALGSLLPVYLIYMRSDTEPINPVPYGDKGRVESSSVADGYKVVSIYYFG